MKKHYLTGLVAASILSLNFLAHADCGDTNSDNCNINGSTTMDAVIVLTATSNAPTNAAGVAKIESENDNGTTSAEIDLKTVGLDPGQYDLSITLQSTGSNVDLGLFTVGSGDGDGDDNGGDGGGNWGWWGNQNQQNDYGRGGGDGNSQGNWIPCNWGGYTNWGAWTNFCDTNFVSGGMWGNWFGTGNGSCSNCCGGGGLEITRTEVELPAGVDPTDIGEVTVSDTNANPILQGSLVTPSPGTTVNISGSVQLTAGDAAPYLNGTAQVHSTASKGKWTHQFNLSATGANAKSSFKVNVNGKLTGATRSSKTGQLSLKKLPSHTSAVRSVQLLDLHGNVAGSAKF